MASVVEICNLALAHLGDTASVASIDPPEGSAQAEHCARFYPIARDSLLEMHTWNFAMRRQALQQLTNEWPQWQYTYALPNDIITAIAVLPPEAENDYSTKFAPSDSPAWAHNYSPAVAAGMYVPQPYTIETRADGTKILMSNQENALLRYLVRVEDPARFSPLFVMALSWHLASMLAGPVIKGDQGAAEAKRCAQMMMAYLSQAKTSDADQRSIAPEHIVGWVAGR